MPKNLKTIITALAIALSLTACFNDEGISESDAKTAIEKMLIGSMNCFVWSSDKPETSIVYDKKDETLASMAEWGWVNVTVDSAKNVLNLFWTSSTPKEGYALMYGAKQSYKTDENVYVVRLTEKGRALHKPAAYLPETEKANSGICSGKKIVSSIKRFSLPAADASGKIVSEIAFKYEFKELGPEFQAKREKVLASRPAGKEMVGVVQLMKTNQGWAPNGKVRYALENI